VIRRSLAIVLALSCVLILGTGTVNAAPIRPEAPRATRLVTGMQSGSGSTIGPDGALYVTEGATGRVLRVNPVTGKLSTFASGLPKSIIGIGGAMDVAFIGRTAYVLVTLVGPDVGGTDVVGIYRVNGPHSFTVLADIGRFSILHPPPPNIVIAVPSGLQYAMQPYCDGFLVTDGHHNRVLSVGLDGKITQLIQFDDIVPTGLAVWRNTIYMAEAGQVPHLPQNGKIVSFKTKSPTAAQVAAGAPLLVDVEFGPGRSLYGLSQGHFTPGHEPGTPADPNTGSLVKAKGDGTFTVITGGLDRPTSLEFIGNTAYVVTLTGEIWKIDGVAH
jgi:hypothetical protein